MKTKLFTLLFICFIAIANSYAANRYWVGGATGTWDATNTTCWSTTSGGANGASVPGATDDVFFDNSAGNANPTVYLLGGTITVNSITFTSSNVIFSGYFTQGCTNSVSTGSFNITLSAANEKIRVGQTVTLAGAGAGTLASGTTVSAISGTTLTLNKKPTANSTATGTLTFAALTITTNNMTLDNSQVTFADAVTINSALTFSGTTTAPRFTGGNGAFILGNGGTFTLTGNSATNYFDGGANTSFRYNTTSALTVFFKPNLSMFNITLYKGLITLGNNVIINRIGFPAANLNNQELILAPNVTLTIPGSASSEFTASAGGGTINASASGSKVLITSIAASVIATTGRIFKANTTINHLEVNTTGTFVLGFPLTVRTLTKTAGTINNTSNNITIAAGGSVVGSGVTITPNSIITGTATTRYWVGGAAGNWFNAASWGTSSGNTSTPGIPEYGDNVVFDASSGNVNPIVTLTDNVTAADITFTSSSVTFAGAYAITTTNMTLDNSQVVFVNAVTINSALTFSGASTIKNTTAGNFYLGNGGAFTLTGNSATNYFEGGGNVSFRYNTTSAITVYFKSTTTMLSFYLYKGLITLGNDVTIPRMNFPAANLNNQELILAPNVTLTLSGGTNEFTALTGGGTINASASGSKVLITSTHESLLGNQTTFVPITGRIFKDGSTINHLEYNSTAVFYLPFAMTVKNLTLTAGTINNSTNNITIATAGKITTASGTTSAAVIAGLPSAPASVTATAGDGQASVAFTAPTANGGSLIADYTVTPYDGATAGTPVTQNANPINVTGLNNGTFYTFKVKANNGVVGSAAETESSAVKPDDILNDITVSTAKSASQLALTPVSDVVVNKDVLLTIDQLSRINSLTVVPGGQVTNSSTLNAATITINSNATDGTGTFIDNGTSTITNAVANQYLGTTRNWYVSSPVESTASSTSNISSYFEYIEAGNNNPAGQPTNSSAYWKGYTPGATFMTMGKGYIALPSNASASIQFNGTFNKGDVTVMLSKALNGYNLIGNPYPSHLTWTEAYVTSKAAQIYPTIWIRTNSGSSNSTGWSFTTHNALVNEVVPSWADVLIAPMQAFWVKAKVGGNLILTSDLIKSHSTSNRLKAPAVKNTNRQRVRLQVSNGTVTDEALLYFDAAAANTVDDYDSPKYMANSTVTQIYTTVGDEKLVINGMNTLPLNQEIGLGFIPGNASSFSIKANEISNLPSDVKVILKDNVTLAETDLTDGVTAYQFSPAAIASNRFSLLFRAPGSSTGIDNTLNQNTQVVVNANNQITIMAPEKASYSIFNAVGQQVEYGIINTKHSLSRYIGETLNAKLKTGVYVVKVNNQSTRVIIK